MREQNGKIRFDLKDFFVRKKKLFYFRSSVTNY